MVDEETCKVCGFVTNIYFIMVNTFCNNHDMLLKLFFNCQIARSIFGL